MRASLFLPFLLPEGAEDGGWDAVEGEEAIEIKERAEDLPQATKRERGWRKRKCGRDESGGQTRGGRNEGRLEPEERPRMGWRGKGKVGEKERERESV